MIVELFGPPGSGKTTFAYALVDRLRAEGQTANLVLSQRPGETKLGHPEGRHGLIADTSALFARLGRPAREFLSIIGHPTKNTRNLEVADLLMQTFPVRGRYQAAKRWQYIVRLCHSWRSAQRATAITVFDQGFVQVVCSLALAANVTDETIFSEALASVPASELAIRLEAPHEIITRRLDGRARSQGLLERMLDSHVAVAAGTTDVHRRTEYALLVHGRTVIAASSLDADSLAEHVTRVSRQICCVELFREKGTYRETDANT